jgi:hypothetical protein
VERVWQIKGGKIRGENGKRDLEVYFYYFFEFWIFWVFMKVFGSSNFTTTQISIQHKFHYTNSTTTQILLSSSLHII